MEEGTQGRESGERRNEIGARRFMAFHSAPPLGKKNME